MGFMPQNIKNRSGAPCGRPVLRATCLSCRSFFPAGRQSNPCLSGFRETNRDGLLG